MNTTFTRLLFSCYLICFSMSMLIAQNCTDIVINGGVKKIEITGLTAPIEKTSFENDYKTINTQDLENGIYWLVIQIDNRKLLTKRFIKEDWR